MVKRGLGADGAVSARFFLGVSVFPMDSCCVVFLDSRFRGNDAVARMTEALRGFRLEYIIFSGGGGYFTLLDGFEGEVIVGDC